MQPAPKALRLHIGLFGRRNVGKSSLLNAITRQQVSIVSAVAGTTTDPVEKPMELLPLGPVLFVDTAGVDDEGALGELRMQRTRAILDRVDIGVVVTEAGAWGAFEDGLIGELQQRKVPVVVAVNKIDLRALPDDERGRLQRVSDALVELSALAGEGWGIFARRCCVWRRRTSSTAAGSSRTSCRRARSRCSWCPSTRRRRRGA